MLRTGVCQIPHKKLDTQTHTGADTLDKALDVEIISNQILSL